MTDPRNPAAPSDDALSAAADQPMQIRVTHIGQRRLVFVTLTSPLSGAVHVPVDVQPDDAVVADLAEFTDCGMADVSALLALRNELDDRGVQLVLINVYEPVRDKLAECSATHLLSPRHPATRDV